MSLRWKTILGIALIEALLLVLLITTALSYMRSTNSEGLVKRADTAAMLFATTTKDAVLSFDLASLEAFASEVLRNPGLLYARVLSAEGEVLAQGGDSQQLNKPFLADSDVTQVTDAVYDTYAEISEAGVVYGRVEIGISTAEIDKALDEITRWSLLIAAAEMVLVALFSYLLGAYLTGQLQRLRQAARNISLDNLNINLDVRGRDEIAEVARAFNKMVAGLRSSRSKRDQYEQQLKELNRSLEQRVEQRTAQLQQRNQALTEANEKIRQTQGQLIQSEKMASVGQLAAGVAHEINNPVGYVMSNLHSLKSYLEGYQKLLSEYRRLAQCIDADPQEAARIKQQIEALEQQLDIEFVEEDCPVLLDESIEGAERVKTIVMGLRDFSREDSGQFQPADLNRCIESTLKIANSQIRHSSSIEADLQPLPPVECNASQLGQVLLNLLVNAAQAIDRPDGLIRVSSRVVAGEIRISVEDNGKGISAEHLNKLFDPFFTTKPVGEGTGLGLSISFGIMQDHGGQIEVTSSPGEGSCFCLILPITRTVQDTGSALIDL